MIQGGSNLGGYFTAPCPNGAGLHAYPWYWSGSVVVSVSGGLPPETHVEPCNACIEKMMSA